MNVENKELKKTKSQRKIGRKQRSLILIIGGVILVVLILIAIKLGNKEEIPQNIVGSEDTAIEEGAMMEIDTPYGFLKYPQKYEEWLEIADTSEENELMITFYTSVTGDEVEMFTVCFGKEDKGEFIGFVKENNKKIPVTIEVVQDELNDNVSEEKKDIYYGMIDGVNEILISIMDFETYTKE